MERKRTRVSSTIGTDKLFFIHRSSLGISAYSKTPSILLCSFRMMFLSLVLIIASTLASSAEAIQSCSSFSINGSHPAAFNFYDFQYPNNSDTAPFASNWPKNRTFDSSAVQRKNIRGKFWTDEWSIRVANKQAATEKLDALHYVPENVFMGVKEDKGFLALNTSRLQNNTQLGGEIFLRPADIDALSLRLSARIYGDSGAVAGFFTYFNDTQESDIEILTRDDGTRVHFTNQPSLDNKDNVIPNTTFNESLPNGRRSSEFITYGLDGLPHLNVSAWYIDGQLLRTSETHVSVASSTVMIDMWSNAGFWSGDMSVWGEAVLEIEWIKMFFNASSLLVEDAPKNGKVCLLEKTSKGAMGVHSFGLGKIGLLMVSLITALLLRF